MRYEEEIEDLEKRLLMYKKGVTGGHTARENLLFKKIKSMENQLDILKRAKAFDAIVKAYSEASSEGQMVYEFSNIIEKYESGESE